MGELGRPAAITIRRAASDDADGIARTFVHSAEYHARFDPERYSVPAVAMISKRSREAWQDPPLGNGKAVTLVAELSGEIVGFLDAQLQPSHDAMHRETVYCHIAEIAVRCAHRNHGIGKRLLQAAEDRGRQRAAQFASLEYHAANTHAGLPACSISSGWDIA
jgi:ribosomal protein S18 acetylase RimI-like enzyme